MESAVFLLLHCPLSVGEIPGICVTMYIGKKGSAMKTKQSAGGNCSGLTS